MSVWPGGEGLGGLRVSWWIGVRVFGASRGAGGRLGAGVRAGFAGRVAPGVRLVISGPSVGVRPAVLGAL